MICAMCKKDKEQVVKIFLRDKATNKSEESLVCVECEGEIERPFVVYVKSRIARAFIQAVKSKGGFVKDTVIKLMREFSGE